MEWWVILIIVLAAPLLLLPIVFIWYVNLVGLYHAIREHRNRTGNTTTPLRTIPQKAR